MNDIKRSSTALDSSIRVAAVSKAGTVDFLRLRHILLPQAVPFVAKGGVCQMADRLSHLRPATHLSRRGGCLPLIHGPSHCAATTPSLMPPGHWPDRSGHHPSSKAAAADINSAAMIPIERRKRMAGFPVPASPQFSGFETYLWYGVFVPSRTPPDIVVRLNRELVEIMRQMP